MFKNGIIPEMLPERIFSILKYIENEDMPLDDVRDRFQNKDLNSSFGYINECIKACEELKLLKMVDGKLLHYEGNSTVIRDLDSFRLYCNSVIWNDSDSSFFKTVNGMLLMNSEVLKYPSISGPSFMQKLSTFCPTINSKTMLGSRFWISFLGIGNIYENGNAITFLPNSTLYLKDLIKLCQLELKVEVSLRDFMDVASKFSSLSFFESASNNILNVGLSLAFRTLHDMKIIELKNNLDSENKYSLYKSDSHGFGNTFTHFIVKKVL